MAKPTAGPWEKITLAGSLDDWTGARFVIRAPGAPGGLAIIMGGLGSEEEEANADLIVDAGNAARGTIHLSPAEFEGLLLLMGYAVGAANREGDQRLFRFFLRLTNAVNRGNPGWIPYEVPAEDPDA
jgi:hypothetical protein